MIDLEIRLLFLNYDMNKDSFKKELVTAKEYDPINGFNSVSGYKELEADGLVK